MAEIEYKEYLMSALIHSLALMTEYKHKKDKSSSNLRLVLFVGSMINIALGRYETSSSSRIILAPNRDSFSSTIS